MQQIIAQRGYPMKYILQYCYDAYHNQKLWTQWETSSTVHLRPQQYQ